MHHNSLPQSCLPKKMILTSVPAMGFGALAGGYAGYCTAAIYAEGLPEDYAYMLIRRQIMRGAVSGAFGAGIGTDIFNRIH